MFNLYYYMLEVCNLNFILKEFIFKSWDDRSRYQDLRDCCDRPDYAVLRKNRDNFGTSDKKSG